MPALFGGKSQYTVVGVGNALFIKHGITGPPDFLLDLSVCENFHRAGQHDAFVPEAPSLIKVDTCLWIVSILLVRIAEVFVEK